MLSFYVCTLGIKMSVRRSFEVVRGKFSQQVSHNSAHFCYECILDMRLHEQDRIAGRSLRWINRRETTGGRESSLNRARSSSFRIRELTSSSKQFIARCSVDTRTFGERSADLWRALVRPPLYQSESMRRDYEEMNGHFVNWFEYFR